MTTYEKLLRAAATCQRDALLVLADCCEEEGRAEAAAGYRWMAENNKWPGLRSAFHTPDPAAGYGWFFPEDGEYVVDDDDLHPDVEDFLGGDRAEGEHGGDNGYRLFLTREEALEAGAKGVGAWLARKESAE